MGSITIVEIVIFLSVLIISVSIHELMHGYVAYRLGDDLAHSQGRISLNPLKHIDPVLTVILPPILLLTGYPPILAAKPVPINTSRIRGEEMGFAAVGIAGPLTNLVLATIGALVYNYVLVDTGMFQAIVELFVRLNVGLFVFNMLPIPPLDGSRVLYAFAPRSIQDLMARFEQFGMITILLIFVIVLPVFSSQLSSANQFILQILGMQ